MDRLASRLAVALIAAYAIPVMAQTPLVSGSQSSSSTEIKPEAPVDLRSPAPTRQEEARRRLQQMSPEQRQKLRENLQRWKAMSKEERDALRLIAHKRRERLEQSVDEFIKKNGWTIDPERRKQLIERFAQERKSIEESLRKEIEEKRRPLLRDMKERLKAEFAPESSGSSTPTSSGSPSAPAPTPMP